MALALDQQWQFDVNRRVYFASTVAETVKRQFIIIKDRLKAFANGVTCKGSSDASSAGMDGSDRLTDYTKVTASASNHSWIVLEWVGGMQVCFDFSVANAYQMTITMSPAAGFTGGSISARPTATDQVTILSAANWTINGSVSLMLHILHSADGKSTRLFMSRKGGVANVWIFGDVADAASSWTTPKIGYVDSASTYDVTAYSRLFSTTARIVARGPSGSMSLFVSQPSIRITSSSLTNGSMIADAVTHQAVSHYLTGGWPIGQMGLWSTTSGMKGKMGRLSDVWLSSPALPGGHVLESGDVRIAKLGDIVVPWPELTTLQIG